MENALVRMQREIAQMNRMRGAPIARAEAMPEDADGYAPPAPAPPKPVEGGGPASSDSRPLPQVVSTGPLKVQTIDLEQKVLHTSMGEFPLDGDGAAVIAGIAVAALQHHFNSMVEQAARAYGIWPDVPVATGKEPTSVSTKPLPATPSATSTGSTAGATSAGGKRRKARRGS